MSDVDRITIRFQLLRDLMDERVKRLWAAAEVRSIGRGGISKVATATGLSVARIRDGLKDLRQIDVGSHNASEFALKCPPKQKIQARRIRRLGAGRKLSEEKSPEILDVLKKLIEHDTAGDPMSSQKWVRCSLRQLSDQLKEKGYNVSSSTVSRLLKTMGFSLKANKRRRPSMACPERDEQFKYIASQKERFHNGGVPVISVDTKKTELIGPFRNNGKTWCRKPEEVDEHDFPSAAEYRAVPFGVFDIRKNRGYVVVGVCNNTPEFAVNSIVNWWKNQGCRTYRRKKELLIVADSGASNGARSKSWKWHLQERLCDKYKLTTTVCHYPTGCSKWNPVEHRLFSYISINWAGKPLKSLDVMLAYIRGTTTRTGLTVKAVLDEGVYRKGHKLSQEDMDGLDVRRHEVCPQWNYTIHPRE